MQPEVVVLKPEDITLTDNRGHRFTVHNRKAKRADRVEYVVDEGENAQWMEFNNGEYFLRLTVNCSYRGKRVVVEWPKIYCTFGVPSVEM